MASSKGFKFRSKELKLFWYWIGERHAIYMRRKRGAPFPWTKDKILRTYKFTNPFRQLDRVTQAWLNRYVALLGTRLESEAPGARAPKFKPPTDGDILFHCALFRLFNWPPTYDALVYMTGRWSYDRALRVLEARQAEKQQIFTGAYIIPNMGSKDPKIDIITAAADLVYENREAFARYIRAERSMEKTCEVLQLVPTIGPFIAYEIACDLRFTRLLEGALDVNTWANPGPGAKRGIHRLLYGSPQPVGKKPDYLQAMRALFATAHTHFPMEARKGCEYPFEMREIEHSLCEFDKYMRVKNGEGRPRSRYKPAPPLPKELPPSKDEVRMFKPMEPPAPVKRVRERLKKDFGSEDVIGNVKTPRHIRGT